MKKQTKSETDLLRQKAEELLRKKQPRSNSKLSEFDTLKLLHELEVHQVELEMQNEELRLAKEQNEAIAEKYTELYDFAPSGYFTLSEKGEIIELNIIGSQILGEERLYLMNKQFGLFVTDNTKPIFNQFFKKIFENRTQENCKIIIKRKDNQYTHIYLSGKVSKNGEQCLLTATDISELIKEQTKLLESEEQFRVASLATGFGAFSFNFVSGETFYSEGFLNLNGLTAGESIELDNNLVAKALHPDNKKRFFLAMQEANNPCGSGILDIEFRIIHKDGGIRWLRSRELTIFTGNKSNDSPIYANGILQDITEEKNAELHLSESESKYRKLHESIRDAFVSVNMKGEIIECNQVYLDMLGYSETEIKKMTYFDLTPVEWHSFEAKIVEEEILPKGFSRVYEKEYRKKDGSVFPVELRSYLIKDNDGNPSLLWAIVRDITDRKRDEETLRRNNARLELAMQTANMAWWEMDIKTGNVTFNKRKAEILGYPAKRFKHYKDFMALVHPDDGKKAMGAMRKLLGGLTNRYEVDYRILTKSGEYKWFHDIGSIVEKDSNGAPQRVTGLVLDISNQKQAEEAMKESKVYLDKIINTVSSPIFVKNEKYQFCLVNNALCKFLGQPSEALIGKTGSEYFPQDQFDIIINKEKEVLETGVENINEELISDGEGTTRTIITRKTRYNDPIGNKFLVGIFTDITERKHIEEAVHEAYQFNKQIIDGAQEGIIVYDRNLRFQVWNPYMENLTGVPASKVLGKNPLDIFPFLKTCLNIDNVKKALNGELSNAVNFQFNIEATGKSGWASDIAGPLYNYKNEIIGVISTVRDITQNKKIELDLIESLKLFYTIFNSSPNAIALNRIADGSYIRVNNRFLELTGYAFEEIKGRNSAEIGLIKDNILNEKSLSIIKQKGKKKDFEIDINTKTGEIRHCLVSIENFTLDKEKYILNNFVDFTERKKIENENKEIKEALENLNNHLVEIRENERASIAREIHDQLGQSLTALKIDLTGIYHRSDNNSEVNNKLKGMIDLTSETIKDVQRISSELRPSILDDIGLSAALEWYCTEFAKRTGLQLYMDINEVQSENLKLNLTVYRVLQESLTNIIRHSGAKNVMVNFSVIEKNLVLLIQDDGIGISQEKVNSLKSFGICGMIERVKQSGGFMEITSFDTGGTLVSVHIPL